VELNQASVIRSRRQRILTMGRPLYQSGSKKKWLCYGLDDRSSIPGRGLYFFSSQRPDRLWGPLSLLSNDYLGLFPGARRVRGV